jgi:hypothetical protein
MRAFFRQGEGIFSSCLAIFLDSGMKWVLPDSRHILPGSGNVQHFSHN